MKKSIVILISFALFLTLGCRGAIRHVLPTQKVEIPVYLPNENCRLVSFKPGSEPEGFNGVKWETNFSTMGGLKHYRTDPSHGAIKFYLKEGDVFKLGNGKALPVQYGFWKGRFYVGMATTESLPDWNALKETIFNKFGEGVKPFKNKEEYLWVGKNAVIALRYDESSKEGFFYIRSEAMAKQMEEYRAEVKEVR